MKSRRFTVIVHKEDDRYVAECPEVGTVDQGETIEQAISGLQAATQLYLKALKGGQGRQNLVVSRKEPKSRAEESEIYRA
ncbi:MAG: type II toxin-antitoxin system HicB family antitoxin [Synechocystis sp.]|jgi:predicted RNase H-like HicB family nuclease